MATKAAPGQTKFEDEDSDIEWDTLTLGLGESWDFDRDGPLVGNYIGTTTREVTDKQTGEKRETNVYQFAPRATPEEVVFVWGSATLDTAFASDLVRAGDLMKISYLGMEQFTDKNTGLPRVVKRFKVQVAKI